MAYYARFDPTASQPTAIIGFYDTDFMPLAAYVDAPSNAELVELTTAQWAQHLEGTLGNGIEAGAVVSIPTPAPTLAQQAQALLNAGFQVQSTGTPSINGTYPADPGTQAKLNGLWNILQKYSGGFPSGVSAIPVVDSAGAPVIFSSATVLENFLTEYAGFVLACDAIIATNAGTLPALPVTIA